MTITRYSGVRQSPGRAQTIYTVPDGKIAKIKFDVGVVDGAYSYGSYFCNRNPSYTMLFAKNGCFVSYGGESARILVNNTNILGSYRNGGSQNKFAANMFVDGNGIIHTYLDTNHDSNNIPYTENAIKSSNDAYTLKNEFILLPGESVQIYTNTTSYNGTCVNYSFTVYEEDL